MNLKYLKGIKPWIQEGPGKYHYIWYVNHLATVELARQNDFCINTVITICRKNFFQYGYDENDMFRIGRLVLEAESKDPDYTKNLIAKWRPIAKEFYDVCAEMDDTNYSELSDQEFSELYKKFSLAYIREYALPMIADMMGYFLETEMRKELTLHLKKFKRDTDFFKIMSVLTNPVAESFLCREKYELCLIARNFIDGMDVTAEIKKHQKKWHWIQNNYSRAIILDETYFLDRMGEHAASPRAVEKFISNYFKNLKAAQIQKQKLIDELKFNKRLRLLVTLIEEYTYWQDKRKEANILAHHYISLFLEDASRRFDVPLKLLEYSTGFELQNLLDGGTIDSSVLSKRLQLTVAFFGPDKPGVLNFEDAKVFLNEFETFDSRAVFGDLHGMVANLGRVVGKARIINSPEEFGKMQQDDILITSMTRPEFMPILKKALAIVTDEGGITSHAAIVARELGIPCVIGTKIATKALKDGDMIEVNANHGIVKKV